MKKIIYYVVTAFVSLVLIINIFSLLNLSLFGFRIFKVASGSMSPYLNVGDVIIIKKSDKYNLKDIVTYKDESKMYVTHRIISIKDNIITTKGDGNNIDDKPIEEGSIIGKVVCRFRFIPKLLSKPITWCLLFVIGTLFIVVIPEKEKEKENQE